MYLQKLITNKIIRNRRDYETERDRKMEENTNLLQRKSRVRRKLKKLKNKGKYAIYMLLQPKSGKDKTNGLYNNLFIIKS